MPRPAYAELHARSNFSFLSGASHPEELAERAAALGYSALAVTDECSLAGVVRAHVAAGARGLPLIVGSEVALTDGPRLVLLATDREGYGNLSDLITRGRRREAKGRYRLDRADLADGLPGCLALLLPEGPGFGAADTAAARWLADLFPGRAWIAVARPLAADDAARLDHARELCKIAGLPLVAAGGVRMHVRARRALADTLTAIRLRCPLTEAGTALLANGERHLRPRARLARLYPPELLAETVRVAGRCTFSLDTLRYEYPEELVPPGETPASHLKHLTEAGMARRWPGGVPAGVRTQVAHELALIAELAYEPYFLTVHDVVRFAREGGILCQGRGSAANSAVCYALGITEVDPARMALLFERFISRERAEPPDIDVDFEHERREEVIQYIYGKYGRGRAALAATVITYRPRSAVRDVGKALGLSEIQVDRLAKSLAWWDGSRVQPERIREAGLDPEAPVTARLLALVGALLGFPRHLSQHVGGFVISRGPLSRLVPIENAAMAERTVIQWDKDDLDALGLLKVDVLALGMLTAIRKALALLPAPDGDGRPFTLADVPAEDPATYEMAGHADTVGVFQIESRAQMAMLPRLRPVTFYDLVIQVAIVRPGPIQGDMVHPYLRRRRGEEPVVYPGPEAEAVLRRTLGVPIFQEQVIQLAMVAAGFSAGEADALRRAMAAWKRKGGLLPFEHRLVEGMRHKGYPEEYARRIFDQIKGFGEYGFPESHAASFALLAYVSAWLKRHHPAAFTCALLNSQPMGFYAPAQLVADARRHGVDARPAAADASRWDCTLEPGPDGAPQAGAAPALRLGLRLVKGLSRAGADRLTAAREQAMFADVRDLARRAGLGRRDLQALADAGALAPLAGHRRRAHWQVLGTPAPAPLAPDGEGAVACPPLPAPGPGEDLVADYGSLGLTLGPHPLALLRERLGPMGVTTAAGLHAIPHGAPATACGLVICRQRPGSAAGVVFLTLEDETGTVNAIVWPALVERARRTLLGARLLAVAGEVQREGEVLHLIARRLTDHTALLGHLTVACRDFH